VIGADGRKILTTFLEQNPWSEVAEKDETTRKEVQIVGDKPCNMGCIVLMI
jgi:hypothetical protein